MLRASDLVILQFERDRIFRFALAHHVAFRIKVASRFKSYEADYSSS